MKPYKLPNAAAYLITVTSTATSLESLIQTAAGVDFKMPAEVDAVDFYGESNNFRYLADDNTPTATEGIPVSSGDRVYLRGLSPRKIKMIRQGASDATVTVQIGLTNPK